MKISSLNSYSLLVRVRKLDITYVDYQLTLLLKLILLIERRAPLSRLLTTINICGLLHTRLHVPLNTRTLLPTLLWFVSLRLLFARTTNSTTPSTFSLILYLLRSLTTKKGRSFLTMDLFWQLLLDARSRHIVRKGMYTLLFESIIEARLRYLIGLEVCRILLSDVLGWVVVNLRLRKRGQIGVACVVKGGWGWGRLRERLACLGPPIHGVVCYNWFTAFEEVHESCPKGFEGIF